MKVIVIFSIFLVGIISFPVALAQTTVEIVLEKDTYSFGEKLFYTIKVSEVTGEKAIIHIRDEFGKGSSAIPVGITQLETPIPSAYPFEKGIFPEGKFFIDVDYSGASDTAEFTLMDSGMVVIPFWVKQVAYYWISPEGISDQTFADAIEFLIEEKIIVIPETQTESEGTETQIPEWVKVSTLWWLEEKITDGEYANALQHLIKTGIIHV